MGAPPMVPHYCRRRHGRARLSSPGCGEVVRNRMPTLLLRGNLKKQQIWPQIWPQLLLEDTLGSASDDVRRANQERNSSIPAVARHISSEMIQASCEIGWDSKSSNTSRKRHLSAAMTKYSRHVAARVRCDWFCRLCPLTHIRVMCSFLFLIPR